MFTSGARMRSRIAPSAAVRVSTSAVWAALHEGHSPCSTLLTAAQNLTKWFFA